jgi:Ca2+-binding RTX toxin-like protein
MTMATVLGTNQAETLDAADGATNSSDSIYGYDGDDALYGLAGDDYLSGGPGADYLNGGAGSDRADYSSSSAGVTVNLERRVGAGGEAEGDTFVSIENLDATHYADVLIGDDEDNFFRGGGATTRSRAAAATIPCTATITPAATTATTRSRAAGAPMSCMAARAVTRRRTTTPRKA